jgi:acid phosphatase family membrane protein YuiD
MTPPDIVSGTELVVAHFGAWPSFHDAEVTAVTMSRRGPEGFSGPTLSFAVHAFLTTAEVDDAGYFRAVRHAVVTFAFFNVSSVELTDFNHQNVLEDIYFETVAGKTPLLEVTLQPCHGISLQFRCSHGRVESVVPGAPAGSQYLSA